MILSSGLLLEAKIQATSRPMQQLTSFSLWRKFSEAMNGDLGEMGDRLADTDDCSCCPAVLSGKMVLMGDSDKNCRFRLLRGSSTGPGSVELKSGLIRNDSQEVLRPRGCSSNWTILDVEIPGGSGLRRLSQSILPLSSRLTRGKSAEEIGISFLLTMTHSSLLSDSSSCSFIGCIFFGALFVVGSCAGCCSSRSSEIDAVDALIVAGANEIVLRLGESPALIASWKDGGG